MRTLIVTEYIRPNGRKEVHEAQIPNDHPAMYMIDNNIKCSVESMPGLGFLMYFDDGQFTPDGEPDELNMIALYSDDPRIIYAEAVQKLIKRKEIRERKSTPN